MLKYRVWGMDGVATCAAVSSDLRLVARGSGFVEKTYGHEPKTKAVLTRTGTGQQVCMLECDEEVSSLDFSQDGTMLATGSTEGTLKMWRLGDDDRPKLMSTLFCPLDMLRAVKFSPDGKKISSVANDTRVRVWSVQTGKLLLSFKGHHAGVQYAAWSPCGGRVASIGYEYTVLVWDANTGTLLMEPLRDPNGGCFNSPQADFGYIPSRVAFGTHTPMLVNAGQGTITVWDLREQVQARVRHVLAAKSGRSCSVSLCPNDRNIASWSFEGDIRVWDAVTGQQIRQLVGHRDGIICVDWSRDSQSLVSVDMDSAICEWSMDEEVRDCIMCVCVYVYVRACVRGRVMACT